MELIIWLDYIKLLYNKGSKRTKNNYLCVSELVQYLFPHRWCSYYASLTVVSRASAHSWVSALVGFLHGWGTNRQWGQLYKRLARVRVHAENRTFKQPFTLPSELMKMPGKWERCELRSSHNHEVSDYAQSDITSMWWLIRAAEEDFLLFLPVKVTYSLL